MRVVRVSGHGEPQGSEPRRLERLQSAQGSAAEAEYSLVLVTWHDAWFDFDQEDPEDCRSDYLVQTVGFLVSDGPRFVSVAQEVLTDGEGFRAVTHIPASIIERITPLTPVAPHIPHADVNPHTDVNPF